MQYVIDGYNLLHAIGLLRARAEPTALRKARIALLQLLVAGLGKESSSLTVVFDAEHAPSGLPAEEDYEGIHVRYAVHEPHADDLIEDIIRQQPSPNQLAVVSDDHRLQRAAQRGHCKVFGCGEFLDWLKEQHKQAPPDLRQTAAKPQGVTEVELQDWLREFADLENDPNWKALSEPKEWDDIDS